MLVLIIIKRFTLICIWLNTIGSTLVGQGLDSAVFIAIAFIGILPTPALVTAIVTQWLFKSAYEVCATPVTVADLDQLLSFYRDGAADADFEVGIETALRALLASPEFLFRIERDPPEVAAGAAYRVSDLELASRLSFFLWSTIPDDELVELAAAGRLGEPDVLEAQARRMLDDPRAETLTTNFATQWLHLRNLDAVPENIRGAVRNNGGGLWNHTLYWNCMTPNAKEPSGPAVDAIKAKFGSVDEFKDAFTKAALGRFGIAAGRGAEIHAQATGERTQRWQLLLGAQTTGLDIVSDCISDRMVSGPIGRGDRRAPAAQVVAHSCPRIVRCRDYSPFWCAWFAVRKNGATGWKKSCLGESKR